MQIAQGMKTITENIEISYGERMSWLADATKDTYRMMSRIGNDHQAMTKALGAFLDNSESTRMAAFKKMLSSIQSRRREREEEVASFLGQSESVRLEEFKKMLAEIKSGQISRQEEVTRLIRAFRKDINEARGHWQNMAKILALKRTGKRVPVAEVPKQAHVPKKVARAAEEAFGEGDIKARIWSVIEANGQGISLRQIGEELKVPYIRLAKSIKELVRENKIAKRDSKYFPA